ncbi:MAG: carbohydrate binding domain-containing protein [Armatimonadetes bacterium]|nr:carbohydrate binding domain-containing protein [Armatimonadota bacterium]
MRALACLLLLLPVYAFAEIPDGWFEFVIAEPAQDCVVDVSAYSPEPAGAAGFVTIRDGHFVDGRGRRIRFLGTNLTFGDAFPDKEMAPRIARRMAQLGINIVRFHHMDHSAAPRGIWDPDFKDRLHIDPDQLDRLDWIIYQLKLNGIYTNLNLHVSRTFSEAEGFENAKQLPKYDKGVDNFEPRMIEYQKQYARDLLTHVNPYTGNAYVNEPCVAMVELNNENSALRYAMEGKLHKLPEPYAGELRDLWHDWLSDRYRTTEALAAAWDEGSEPLGEEMLENGDFAAGTERWTLEAPKPAEGVMEVVDDPAQGRVLHAKLTALGSKPWHFQIHQTGHTLEDGRLYTVSFRAKADPPRTIRVNVRYDVPDWRMVGLDQPVELDGQWREFSFTFRAKEPKPGHTRLSFNNGNSLGEVWLARVSLRPGGLYGLPEGQSLEERNIAFPTSASTRRARVDWAAFAMELERRYTQGMYDFLKNDLGLHAGVIDTQATYGGVGGLLRESRMDYIDTHAYWQHPRFPHRPWDGNDWYIPNTPMTAALGRDTLTRLSLYRLADKPYTVSEYNHPAPNDYRAECMPMLASFAALQDWDGVFQFCYGETPQDWSQAAVQSYFRMATDPAKLAFFPVAANLFRRGDLAPAAGARKLVLPRDRVADWMVDVRGGDMGELWRRQEVEAAAAVTTRLSVEFTDTGEPRVESAGQVTPAGGPVRWKTDGEGGGTFVVTTPRTVVALGSLAGRTVNLPGLDLQVGETDTGFAAVALTSMDDKPLAQSSRMLLVIMSGCENQEMGWNDERTTVLRKWGHGPTICEGVPATVTFDNRNGLAAWALDGEGRRGARIDPDARGTFQFGPERRTIWYEIGTG